MEILYLVFDSIDSPIVKSQVYEMSKSIAKKSNYKFKIITVEKNNMDSNSIAVEGIEIVPVSQKGLLRTYINFLIKVIKNYNGQGSIIHVRSYLPMPIALFLKFLFKAKVIFDMRGLLPEEHIYLNNKSTNSINYKLLKSMERIFVKKSDEIIVVSKIFQEYILNKYEVSNITVIYCSANDEIIVGDDSISYDQLRYKYGMSDGQILIAYVGSFYKYQNIDQIVDFISKLSDKTDLKFAIFTKNKKAEVLELLKKYDIDIKNIIIDFVPNKVLVNYLKHFDYGVIIRDNNIINQVSSPIKISEYIINDMKVLFSGSLGDFNTIIPEHNLGYDIADPEILKLEKIKPLYKNSNEIKKIVSYDYNSDKYIGVYDRVADRG